MDHTDKGSYEQDIWYYPPDIAHDLKDADLSDEVKGEVLNGAWEYVRCVIPQYTNWNRYIAFTRLVAMCIITEFKGNMVDVTAGDNILGYSLSATLSALFEGTAGHEDMEREFRSYLLITADKTSNRRNGELFRRYVNALVQSPGHWFRMRDCDGLARFAIAAALACNDLDDVWFSEEQFSVLADIVITMYDAVAFYKHRSEGEIHNTFAYMPDDMRANSYRRCREVLWALDAAWARQTTMRTVVNCVRYIGGPVHMTMRRYRFVEDDLAIGTPETEHAVARNRTNFKLWTRVDANQNGVEEEADMQRYRNVLARSDELMFQGLAEFLESGGDGSCGTCHYRTSYGAKTSHRFGGVELCDGCRAKWRDFLESFSERAAQVFPELLSTHNSAIASVVE